MQRTRVRRIGLWIISVFIATLMLISYSAAQTKMAGEVNERGAPLFNDLGSHQFAISTKSTQAQKYFNQGLILINALETRYTQQAVADRHIHAVESSPYPERALPSAERLGEIAPGAGHLVHMPSHIYLRVGRMS